MVDNRRNFSFLVYFDECSDCLPQVEEDSGVSTFNIAKAREKRKPVVNFAKTKICQNIGTQVQGLTHWTRVQWMKREAYMKLASELQI